MKSNVGEFSKVFVDKQLSLHTWTKSRNNTIEKQKSQTINY